MATTRHLQLCSVEATNTPSLSRGRVEAAADTVMPSNKRLYGGTSRRLKMIRQHCRNCAGGTSMLVEECPGEFAYTRQCPLWPWRFGVNPATAIRHRKLPVGTQFNSSLAKAIRQHCLQCCGDSAQEVKLCPSTDCRLWEWRFGVRPETALRRGWQVEAVRRLTAEATPAPKRAVEHQTKVTSSRLPAYPAGCLALPDTTSPALVSS